MTEFNILEELKEHIEEKTANVVWLEKYREKITDEIEFVNPEVCTQYIPPKYDAADESHIPFISVMIDEGTETLEESLISIRIVFAVSSMSEDNSVVDNKGYKDLLHIIAHTRLEIKRKGFFKNMMIEPPFKWGMYEEQPYPLWFGYLMFNVRTAIIEPEIEL